MSLCDCGECAIADDDTWGHLDIGKRYASIVMDPPWPYAEGFASGGTNHLIRGAKRTRAEMTGVTRASLPYPSMHLEAIERLPIRRLATDDCRLFLWATNKYLTEALAMLPGWGFAYKQLLVWDKRPNVNPLSGSVAPNSGEFLIVATRGKPKRVALWAESIVNSRKPRTEHSRKPEVFLDLVEAVSPGPYLELFARRNRIGWDTWGNEALEHVEIPA